MAKEMHIILLVKVSASFSFNGEMCGWVQNSREENDE